MDPRIREDNGRGGRGGGRAVPEPLLRGVGHTAYNGRPQGSPLQEKDDGGLGMGDDRFFTPLRYVQNDMGGALRSE